MFKSASLAIVVLGQMALLPIAALAQAQSTPVFQNVGRAATVQEVKAWDIDVRPDFKGLPAGQGSVKQGEALWDAQCQSCHGHFGESAEFFTPIAAALRQMT